MHVNGTESEVQKLNYTWEELQTQIKNVFNLTLTAQNEGRKKQEKPKITAELLFLSSDIMHISKDSESKFDVTFSTPLATMLSISPAVIKYPKDIESEFDITFSPPLASMLGINPAIIKCLKYTTYVQFEYVVPKVVDTVANIIHFTPSDSADYSVTVNLVM